MAEAPWNPRKEGARLAVENARRDVQAFLSGSFERLAAELLPPSMEAQARLAAALEAWSNLRSEWSRVTVAVGIPPDEVSELDPAAIQPAVPTEVPVPAPVSVVGGPTPLVGANEGGE